jgi:hypothetical protein
MAASMANSWNQISIGLPRACSGMAAAREIEKDILSGAFDRPAGLPSSELPSLSRRTSASTTAPVAAEVQHVDSLDRRDRL